MTHALKTWTEYYKEIEIGHKAFEIRKFDRPFKVGEVLLLQEWDNIKNEYTGKEMRVAITYILSGDNTAKFGLMSGYCIMSIKDIEY
jgi:hypothetical protein